ncbi:pimeloyl-ACP methyl ester carboxylesterase [Jatrophihabitans sp. GAS493]|uniref:alpha/beta fold hydrolase n=1 Tax=Jatrophihabitans sp. GAS493 TaxID=1907575 RepID=UPI000BB9B2C8|nr:alpha/beta hydrolase [Jatrophihabitans sp. GAS493]SOD73165.1 pimeloyl-ACP methyl ester carboxylesterase [Jatrophihabitans sp. GAS493]
MMQRRPAPAVELAEPRQLADVDVPLVSIDTARGSYAALQIGDPDAPAVLLVPGFTGSKEDFAPILRPIAECGYFVTAVDQRGQYQSAGQRVDATGAISELESDYTTAALAEDLLAVIATLPGRTHLIGHSFGGLVARAAAIARPEAVASFVLMDSGPSGVDESQRERLDLLRPVLLEYGIEAVYQGMELLAASEEGYAPPPPELADFLHTRFVQSSPTMLLGMGDALLSEPDRVDELRATGLPIVVLHGRDEDVWLPPAQIEMAERLGVERIVIPDAAHSPAADNPAPTIEALVGFWRSDAVLAAEGAS